MPVYVARILVCTWWWPRAAIVCAAVGVECTPNLVSAAKADGVLTSGEYCWHCKLKPAYVRDKG